MKRKGESTIKMQLQREIKIKSNTTTVVVSQRASQNATEIALPLPKNAIETKENSLASTKRSKFRAAENSQSPKPKVNLKVAHQ